MKLISWNVNGLRAVLKKGALQNLIAKENPDVLCLQEIKAKPAQIKKDFPEFVDVEPGDALHADTSFSDISIYGDYLVFWNPAERSGYSGTATFVKKTIADNLAHATTFPPELCQKFNLDLADSYGNPCSEGRVQILTFKTFTLVNVYVPNSKPDLSRLKLRHDSWDPALRELLGRLSEDPVEAGTRPVIICGDFNAAHTEIDLARPKQNEKNAGYTKEEREGIDNILKDMKDAFREFHPTDRRYTWWSHWGHARENNVGWRIDYFLVTPDLLLPSKTSRVASADILESYLGSDHCPIVLEVSNPLV